jgi:hypothetical protein
MPIELLSAPELRVGRQEGTNMQTLSKRPFTLEEIESDADFVVFSEERGLLSEHYSIGEAHMAFYSEARAFSLGDQLPTIYRREEPYWVPLS